MARERIRGEQRVNHPPIVKLKSTLAGFLVSVGATLLLGIEIVSPILFVTGLAAAAAGAAFAAVISRRQSLWRLEAIAAAAFGLAIACIIMALGAEDSPMEFAAVLVVLWFAGLQGRRNVIYGALACLTCLVLPAYASGDTTVHVLIAVSATVVLTIFALIYNRSINTMRVNMQTLHDLAESQELLLKKSVESAEQLRASEAERHTAEQMLRGLWVAVTEQAAIGTDLNGLIDVWNPGAVKMLGASAESTEGMRSISEFHLPSELRELVRERRNVRGGRGGSTFKALVELAHRGEPDVREWTYRRDNGSELPVQVSVTSRVNEDGTPVGYLFVANDLTEAQNRSRLKDEFVSLISHELRTPLSSILGYLELMRDEEDIALSDTQVHYLDIAERNAHRLLRLVGDLLFTAQVESGEFRLHEEMVDLGPLVAASIESARPAASTSAIEMVHSEADGVLVLGDPVRLGQAVDNLLSNAIKFTPRGGRVSVDVETDGPTAVVTVRDTGMGIPADELDKLFSRFFRTTSATRNAVQGVGLGLTITKSIVTAHRGQMTVESKEGVGTSFSIRLPLAEATAVAGAATVSVSTGNR
jgi:PAS domain S-box-containing protein